MDSLDGENVTTDEFAKPYPSSEINKKAIDAFCSPPYNLDRSLFSNESRVYYWGIDPPFGQTLGPSENLVTTITSLRDPFFGMTVEEENGIPRILGNVESFLLFSLHEDLSILVLTFGVAFVNFLIVFFHYLYVAFCSRLLPRKASLTLLPSKNFVPPLTSISFRCPWFQIPLVVFAHVSRCPKCPKASLPQDMPRRREQW